MSTYYRFALPFLLLLLGLSACTHRYEPQTSISGVVNHYAAVLDKVECGFVVDDTEGWKRGDLVLVIQMQGARIENSNTSRYGTVVNYGSAGLYEFNRVSHVDGSTIWLENNLVNTYMLSGNVQLVLVPEYNDVTVSGDLTSRPWNGRKGGVVAISASGKVTLAADIDASASGFRGGVVHEQVSIVPNYEGDYVSNNREKHSEKGESIYDFGLDAWTLGRGAPANGGGGGGNHNGGGGGGANSGCGGNGGYSYQHPRYSGDYKVAQGLGGHALDNTGRIQRLFLGGGGGAGHTNNSTSSDGGNGGGIILIRASQVVCNGHTIRSRGEDAKRSKYDGGSGGGAGGTVALLVQRISEGINIDVSGGNGGDSYNDVEHKDVGTGGGGGGGTVRVSGNGDSLRGVQVLLDGGKNGKTIRGSDYGATPGCSGQITRDFNVPHGVEQCNGEDDLRRIEEENIDLGLSSVNIAQ
ncbi:MAG: hypothetical protein AB7H80_03360 [Candidatus Kapaibacterium sp.]